MKHLFRPYLPPVLAAPGDGSFTQGLVAAGCISAFQDMTTTPSQVNYKRVLRHGLQGGTAFAAGSRAALALHHRDYAGALIATALGAAGVLLIENLLRDSTQPQEENQHV